MYLADQVLSEVCIETTTKGLWMKLENTYLGKNMTNKLWLKKKLYNLRISKRGDLIAHIQKFNQICSEVMSLDVKIEEKDRALLLLCSLLGSYNHLITTLVYGKETLNYEEIVGVLRSNEQSEKICKGDPNSEVLAVNERLKRSKEKVRSKSKGRSKSQDRKKTLKCYKCYQPRHLRRNYPLLKSEKEKASKSGDIASVSSREDLLVVSDGSTECDMMWMLDPACSHHYT